MNYQNFDLMITSKYGIVLENWPLPTFKAPSDYHSKADMEALYSGWESGTTQFRQLSAEELEHWHVSRGQCYHDADKYNAQVDFEQCSPDGIPQEGLRIEDDNDEEEEEEEAQAAWQILASTLSTESASSPPATETSQSPTPAALFLLPTPSSTETPSSLPQPPLTQAQMQHRWAVPGFTKPTQSAPLPTSVLTTPIYTPSAPPTTAIPPSISLHSTAPIPVAGAQAGTAEKRPLGYTADLTDTDGTSGGLKRPRKNDALVNVGVFSDGQLVFEGKRRKERADKGKKRGPNKRTQIDDKTTVGSARSEGPGRVSASTSTNVSSSASGSTLTPASVPPGLAPPPTSMMVGDLPHAASSIPAPEGPPSAINPLFL